MGLSDVLNGDKPIQVSVGIDLTNAIIIGIGLFIVVALAGIVIKKL